VKDFVAEVITWIIKQMPKLELVVCLGKDSWTLTVGAFDNSPPLFNQVRGRGPRACVPCIPHICFAAVSHTANHFMAANRQAEWAPLIDFVNK
jgi:hypothetical protein